MRRTISGAIILLVTGCLGWPGSQADTPGPSAMTIPRVQGAGHLSPLVDQEVAVTGVVTAVTQDGFYLQDPEGDGDPATSDGIFVFTGGPFPTSAGDRLRVTGTVEEHVPGGSDTDNLTVTRLGGWGFELLRRDETPPEHVVLGSGGRIPPGVKVIGDEELPVNLRDPEEARANEFDPHDEGIDFWESLEGMRVRVPDPVAVGPVRRFAPRNGELWVLTEGGAHVTPDDARTFRGGILLQPHPENRGDQNPERIQLQWDPDLTGAPVPELATGATLDSASGIVGYAFGSYEVVLTQGPRASAEPPRPEATALRAEEDEPTLASYNVLNLNPLPENRDRMARVGEHVALHLGAPHIVALQEIQDQGGTRGGEDDPETSAAGTLRALVEAILAAGGPRYEFFDVAPEPNAGGGVPGGNIRNAFLYDSGRVRLVDYRALTPGELRDAEVRDPEAFRGSRDPLLARFVVAGDTITVINNHLTSRFGSTPVFGARQPFVQAGEEARAAQTRALHDVVAGILSRDPGAAVVVLGDLNTFEWTDDLDRFLPGEGDSRILHDLALEVPPGERYTYVFEGNSQALDHIFVSRALRDGAQADIVHLNADYPEGAPSRASDHEPVLVRLRIR